MVTAVRGGQDHQLKSPFLTKKDDPRMPSIYCSINGYNFYKTTCDTGSGVNIMAAVTYRLLFGTMPLKPTYIQLQMADQTFREVKGTVTGVPVKIDDHFVYTDFQVIDMGEDEYDPPIISLEDRSSAPLKQSSTLELEKSICTSPTPLFY